MKTSYSKEQIFDYCQLYIFNFFEDLSNGIVEDSIIKHINQKFDLNFKNLEDINDCFRCFNNC
jgi:hypothetical protein